MCVCVRAHVRPCAVMYPGKGAVNPILFYLFLVTIEWWTLYPRFSVGRSLAVIFLIIIITLFLVVSPVSALNIVKFF